MRIPIRGTPDDWFIWLRGNDEERRHEATLMLGGLVPDDPVGPEAFIPRLESPDQDTVFWAVTALACLERRSIVALPALIQVGASHAAFGVRQAALGALTRIAPFHPAAKHALLYALGDDSLWVRTSALAALIDVTELNETELAAIRALEQDPEPFVRDQVEITLRNSRLRASPAT